MVVDTINLFGLPCHTDIRPIKEMFILSFFSGEEQALVVAMIGTLSVVGCYLGNFCIIC